MDNNIDNIVNFYANYGLLGVAVLVLTFLAVAQFSDFGRRINKVVIYKIFQKSGKEKIPYNSFIRKIEHIRDYDINSVAIKCPKRRDVFRDFAISRMDSFIYLIKSIKDKDFCKMNNSELYYFFTEESYKARECSSTNVLKKGVPIEVVDRMKEIENDEVKIFENLVSNICASNSDYISNNEKVAVIIDFLCALLGMTVLNAETAVDSLNGQLDSLVYHGCSCYNCKITSCKKKKQEKQNV